MEKEVETKPKTVQFDVERSKTSEEKEDPQEAYGVVREWEKQAYGAV